MIDTIFLAWTSVVPVYFFYAVLGGMFIHAVFFSIIDNWL